MNKREIGQAIAKQLAINKGIYSKNKVSKEGNISPLILRRIEQGKQNYTIDSLLLFLDRIGLEIDIKEKEKDSIL